MSTASPISFLTNAIAHRFGAAAALALLALGLASARADSLQVFFNQDYDALVADNEAHARASPDNPDKKLLQFIAAATSTLEVCVYDIADPGIAQALVDAHARGVAVRVYTDSDNLVDPTLGGLRPALLAMQQAGIPIRTDDRPAFMHHKFLVADHRAVWFGSMNLTSNALYRDNNNSLWAESRELAENFEDVFRRLFDEQRPGDPAPDLPHRAVTIGDASLDLYISPNGGAQQAILDAVGKARHRVRFMAFAFTDPALAEAMVALGTNVTLQGVFDSCQLDMYTQMGYLRRHGCHAWRDGNQALLHHKVILVDDDTVITGSFNFTRHAERENNEALAIIRSPALAAAYEAEFQRMLRAARTHHHLPPYDHPACNHRG